MSSVKDLVLEAFVRVNRVSQEKAEEIFDYYQKQFLIAKLKGIAPTGYREDLDNLVHFNLANKRSQTRHTNSILYSLADTDYTRIKIQGSEDGIESYINTGMLNYIRLQYEIDSLVDALYDQRSFNVSKLEELRAELNNFSKFSASRPSYFNTDSPDIIIADDRRRHLKLERSYTHKSTIHYLCSSTDAVYDLTLRGDSPFRFMFDRMIKDGCDIRIGQVKPKYNISRENGVLVVYHWQL